MASMNIAYRLRMIRNGAATMPEIKSSQVKLLITNISLCIVQRSTAQSKTGIFCGYGLAEASPGFQAGWSDCMFFVFFSLFLVIFLLNDARINGLYFIIFCIIIIFLLSRL
jgi:hypothetical protein